MQHAIYLHRLKEGIRRFAVLKIVLAAAFDLRDILLHDHILGPSQFFDQETSGTMIEVCVTDQQDFHILKTKAQLLDAGANERHGAFETAVNEDASLRRRDQIRRQPFGADVVDVADDAVRRGGLTPIAIRLSEQEGRY